MLKELALAHPKVYPTSLFNHVYIFIGCIDFSSWLGLACIVLFLILTVHSYVAPTLNKFIYLLMYFYLFNIKIEVP